MPLLSVRDLSIDFFTTFFGVTRGLYPVFARDIFAAGPQGAVAQQAGTEQENRRGFRGSSNRFDRPCAGRECKFSIRDTPGYCVPEIPVVEDGKLEPG